MTQEELVALLSQSGRSQPQPQRQSRRRGGGNWMTSFNNPHYQEESARDYNQRVLDEQRQRNYAADTEQQLRRAVFEEKSQQEAGQLQARQNYDKSLANIGNIIGAPTRQQGMMTINGQQFPSMRANPNFSTIEQLQNHVLGQSWDQQTRYADSGVLDQMAGLGNSQHFQGFAKDIQKKLAQEEGQVEENFATNKWRIKKDKNGKPIIVQVEKDPNAGSLENIGQPKNQEVDLTPYQMGMVERFNRRRGNVLEMFGDKQVSSSSFVETPGRMATPRGEAILASKMAQGNTTPYYENPDLATGGMGPAFGQYIASDIANAPNALGNALRSVGNIFPSIVNAATSGINSFSGTNIGQLQYLPKNSLTAPPNTRPAWQQAREETMAKPIESLMAPNPKSYENFLMNRQPEQSYQDWLANY